jgi:site-specific DNA-methyltransferase (adenine-specific)
MKYKNYLKECYGLTELSDNSVDTIVTDPPYGIKLEEWDKMPNKSIWQDCFRVLKPGGFLLCFSSIQFQHLFTQQILEAGFEFQDVLLWTYLNGRVPPINVDQQIDKSLSLDREIIGEYKYIQGSPNSKKKSSYTKKSTKTKSVNPISSAWTGFGTGLKTAYEPIIMVQKPLEGTLPENILKYGLGAVNIDATRIPYDKNESGVGHNPHPKGRVMSNIIQTEPFGDYQKFFFVGKVRDGKKTGNFHPTKKPVELMKCLITLVSKPGQIVVDPFLGSGSTGIAALELDREFIGYENKEEFYKLSEERFVKHFEKNEKKK